MLTLPTLELLQRCLHAQQLSVGDPAFRDVAPAAVAALTELEAAIASSLNADVLAQETQ